MQTELVAVLSTLGFRETNELRRLRAEWVAVMLVNSLGASKAMATRYQTLAQEMIAELPQDQQMRAELGHIITMALARLEGGYLDRYRETLDDALDLALGMGYEDVVDALRSAIAQIPKDAGIA